MRRRRAYPTNPWPAALNATLVVFEQFRSELRLQPLDLRADRRLRAIERTRGARERQLICDGKECFQKLGIQGRTTHDGS
jgi:hypothetical protein